MLHVGLVRRVLQQSILYRSNGTDEVVTPTRQQGSQGSSIRGRGYVSLCSPLVLVILAAMVFTLIQDSNGTGNGIHCGKPLKASGNSNHRRGSLPPTSPLPTFLRVFEDCASNYDVGVTIGDVLRWITPVLPSHVNVCPIPKHQPFGMDGLRLAPVPPQHAAPHIHPMVLFTEELLHVLETNTQSREMIVYIVRGLVLPSVRLLYVTLPFLISHFLFRPAFPVLEPTILGMVLALFVAREVCRRTQGQRTHKSFPFATLDFVSTFGWSWLLSAVMLSIVAAVATSSAAAMYNSISPYLVARLAGVGAATVRYETGLFRRQILMC